MKRIIIGLAGQKGCGKTSAALRLEQSGFVILSFASLLRAMLCPFLLGFGYSLDQIEHISHEDKESIIKPFGKSYRQLMQTLGTEWGRDLINQDLWVMAARCQIERLTDRNIVFDDVRFKNEATMIRSMGGLIIHINRESDDMDTHVSEAGIDEALCDMYINNDDTLDYFLVEIGLVVSGLIRS